MVVAVKRMKAKELQLKGAQNVHNTRERKKKNAFPNSLNKEHLSKRAIRQVVNVVLQLTGPFRKISLRFQGYFFNVDPAHQSPLLKRRCVRMML